MNPTELQLLQTQDPEHETLMLETMTKTDWLCEFLEWSNPILVVLSGASGAAAAGATFLIGVPLPPATGLLPLAFALLAGVNSRILKLCVPGQYRRTVTKNA